MEALTLVYKAKMVSPIKRSIHHFCLFVWTFLDRILQRLEVIVLQSLLDQNLEHNQYFINLYRYIL